MKLHTTIATAVAAFAIVLPGPTSAQEKESGKPSKHDEAWAQMTAMSDAAELKLAKAAQEKGSSEAVKKHAQKMIQDHQKTTEELKQIAKTAKLDIKAEMPEAKKEMIEEITSKSGEEFDKAYMMHEVAAHRMAVAHFQNGAEFNKNPELKSFAEKNLPTLQQHLADVEKGGHSQHSTSTPGRGSSPGTAGSTGGQPAQGSKPTSGQVRTE